MLPGGVHGGAQDRLAQQHLERHRHHHRARRPLDRGGDLRHRAGHARLNRDGQASPRIARVLYDGYGQSARQWANARYGAAGSAGSGVAAN